MSETPNTPPPSTPSEGTGTASWYGGFPDEVKGYVESKGFKDPQAVVESYRNLEKLHGVPKERIIKLPEKEDDPTWSEIYGRLGRPEKADGYNIKVPDGLSPDFSQWARDVFHGLGLSKKQGDQLAAKWNERVSGMITKEKDGQKTKLSEQEAKLKQEWGAAYDQNNKTVEAFAAQAELTDEQILALGQVLGVDGANKFLHSIVTKFGIKLGEQDFHGGSGGNNFGAMTPTQAMARIDQLKSDPEYVKRYLSGSASEKAEMERLFKWANASAA